MKVIQSFLYGCILTSASLSAATPAEAINDLIVNGHNGHGGYTTVVHVSDLSREAEVQYFERHTTLIGGGDYFSPISFEGYSVAGLMGDGVPEAIEPNGARGQIILDRRAIEVSVRLSARFTTGSPPIGEANITEVIKAATLATITKMESLPQVNYVRLRIEGVRGTQIEAKLQKELTQRFKRQTPVYPKRTAETFLESMIFAPMIGFLAGLGGVYLGFKNGWDPKLFPYFLKGGLGLGTLAVPLTTYLNWRWYRNQERRDEFWILEFPINQNVRDEIAKLRAGAYQAKTQCELTSESQD